MRGYLARKRLNVADLNREKFENLDNYFKSYRSEVENDALNTISKFMRHKVVASRHKLTETEKLETLMKDVNVSPIKFHNQISDSKSTTKSANNKRGNPTPKSSSSALAPSPPQPASKPSKGIKVFDFIQTDGPGIMQVVMNSEGESSPKSIESKDFQIHPEHGFNMT